MTFQSVRRADDYSAITALWTVAGLSYRPAGRDSRDAYVRQVAEFGDFFLVAAEGVEIVGSVFGTHDGRKGWVNRLAVHPRRRRQGVGSRLVKACDMALRASGIDIVAALIEPDNEESLALFQKLGYLADAPVV